jgi:hypothetical protein
MRFAPLIAALALALALAGCASDEAIIPVRTPAISLLCIKANPEVRPDFADQLRTSLGEHGFRTLVYGDRAPPGCRYRLLYWAGWRWDLKEYLYFAALRVYDGDRLIGQSSYDERFGATLSKYAPTEEKIAAMVEKLFPDRPSPRAEGAHQPAARATAGRLRSGAMAASPASGPGASSHAVHAPHSGIQRAARSIETIVIAKPMLFWIARLLPTSSGGQARAESAENCGESATTATPHASMSASAMVAWLATSGKASAQARDPARAPAATAATP